MSKTTITNLKSKAAKLAARPVARTKFAKKPAKPGLASGLTQQAIKVFKLAKEQQKTQAVAAE
jgi:hypothetical protein